MSESPEHKRLKIVAADWLRNHRGCGFVTTEADIIGLGRLKQRPDVFGIVTEGLMKDRYRPVEVECEPKIAGIQAELKKPYRIDPTRAIAQERWLMYPTGLLPDLDTLKVPVWFGLLECSTDGVVSVVRPPEHFNAWNHRAERAIMASTIINLQNRLRCESDTARPSQQGGLGRPAIRGLAGQIAEVVHRLSTPELPETHLSKIAKELNVKRGMIAKEARRPGGIEGLIYDSKALTLEPSNENESR